MTYTLTLSSGTVVRDADSAIIAPCQDATDPDYVAYVEWCNNGNTPSIIQVDPATILEMKNAAIEQNINDLWEAAHNYEANYISGMAVGILTIGVISGSPKALAIAAWSASIWNLYYQRKALVTDTPNPELLDFSSCGALPFTVPELRAELGM